MDIREIAIFADYFVICSGTSDRMLHALAGSAEERVLEQFKVRARIEGSPNDGWLLVDFGDVILHLFSPEQRKYYSLEELWAKAKTLLHL